MHRSCSNLIPTSSYPLTSTNIYQYKYHLPKLPGGGLKTPGVSWLFPVPRTEGNIQENFLQKYQPITYCLIHARRNTVQDSTTLGFFLFSTNFHLQFGS